MTTNADSHTAVTKAWEGLAQRIRALLDDAGIAQDTLEQTAGVASGTVAKWLCGELQDIGHDQAARIQEAHGFNMFWLITGRGNQRIPSLIGPGLKAAPKYLNSYHPESFAARLHYAMGLRGVRQKSDIAEAGGVSMAAVSLWFNGSEEAVDDEKMVALVDFHQILTRGFHRNLTHPKQRSTSTSVWISRRFPCP